MPGSPPARKKRINRRNDRVGGSWQERGGGLGGVDRSLFSAVWKVWVQCYEMRLEGRSGGARC